MRDHLDHYRIELKWTVVVLFLLAGLILLRPTPVLSGFEARVNDGMDWLTARGMGGIFVIALLANATLVILLPYTLPLMTLTIYAASLGEALGFGAAAGLGAGIGTILSYSLAQSLVTRVETLESSIVFRWTRRTIEREPRSIPLFAWLVASTPVPNPAVLVPLAMINYPWRKLLVPVLAGKIAQNVCMALVYFNAAAQIEHRLADDINFDMTVLFAVIFVAYIACQIEHMHLERCQDRRARALRRDDAPQPVHSQV